MKDRNLVREKKQARSKAVETQESCRFRRKDKKSMPNMQVRSV